MRGRAAKQAEGLLHELQEELKLLLEVCILHTAYCACSIILQESVARGYECLLVSGLNDFEGWFDQTGLCDVQHRPVGARCYGKAKCSCAASHLQRLCAEVLVQALPAPATLLLIIISLGFACGLHTYKHMDICHIHWQLSELVRARITSTVR
jgi:hypothetical protein